MCRVRANILRKGNLRRAGAVGLTTMLGLLPAYPGNYQNGGMTYFIDEAGRDAAQVFGSSGSACECGGHRATVRAGAGDVGDVGHDFRDTWL